MIWLGIKMLVNDRVKYLGLIVGITFATLLIGQQLSIFVGALSQTVSTVKDVARGDVWVSRVGVETIDFNDPLRDADVLRIRGVYGVKSAVPLYISSALARTAIGTMRQVTLVGVDDTTLIGGPGRMLFGSIDALRRQDAVIVDTVGNKELFGNNVAPGSTLELNRQRVEVVGLCRSSPQFSGLSLMITRRSIAARLANEPRDAVSWVLVDVAPGHTPDEVARRINLANPDLNARPRPVLETQVIAWFQKNSGITEVLGLAIILGLVVGTVIVGQTFYMFATENLRHYAALKAIGLGNGRLLLIIVAQAALVSTVGVGLGLGLTAGFFHVFADDSSPLRGMGIPRSVALLTTSVVIAMTIISAMVSARRVLTADPAIVFRG